MENLYKEFLDENMSIDTYRYKRDKKYHLFSNNKSRILNVSSGYAFDLPTNNFDFDYSYSALRCKYFFDDCVLTTSFEDKNPYTDKKEKGWEIYLDEWLVRYISHEDFLTSNKIEKIKENVHIYTFLNKFELVSFSYYITDSEAIERPYYNIAIVRNLNDYKNFYLFVMKSKTNRTDYFDFILDSFKQIPVTGKVRNVDEVYPLNINPKWNKMTKRYFNKLVNQQHCDWGMFIKSLTSREDGSYKHTREYYKQFGLRLDNLMGHDMELLPTYMHISWANTFNYFPMTLANKLAKGNGFNGKKVLHFTFQYTANNNTSMFGYSPTYDILRGKYDDYFRTLARDLKKYHYPVLFRLNNEMNTDWTSYAGIASLLDPDIFIITWKRLYNIFEEEGVDNCIWIFNPFGISTPYCNWGEYLNYYPKGMVNMLGLTAYERGNEADNYPTFRKMYKDLYKKNSPYFIEFPHIISEFGAGAGGEVMYDKDYTKLGFVDIRRNLKIQKRWVKNMFIEFAKNEDYLKNTKAAIWFSVNDYGYIDGKPYIMNYFALDDTIKPTIKEFKKGFKKVK